MEEYILKQKGSDTVISIGNKSITVLTNRTVDAAIVWFKSNFQNAKCKIT